MKRKILITPVLPKEVVEQIRAAWKTSIKDSNGKPIY
ncbi:phosphate ABC transporter periplasmic substrate-binding protein PstS [Proteus mirabilis]|uniref:Phosphate ABC transporter periplasmic substrate-binding protein PstS n=1 Tax=Proteus mirabilis TaxID=584 RepID=A0A2X2C2U6_PROMI|nr:phosphate ABC transporter periplasmic substrate-binding protein PstS [Proteus mirabilis]